MVRKNTKLIRGIPEFEELLRKQSVQRMRNGIDTKQRTPADMMKLYLRAPSLKKLDFEVCTLPTKEQLFDAENLRRKKR